MTGCVASLYLIEGRELTFEPAALGEPSIYAERLLLGR